MSSEEFFGTVTVTEDQYLALKRACQGKCFDDLQSVVNHAVWSFCKRHEALDGHDVQEKARWSLGEFDEFCSTCLEGNAKFSMTGGYLYKLYMAWAKSVDRGRVTPRMFAVEAGRRFPKKRTSQGIMYQGIRPKPTCDLLSVKYSAGYVRSSPRIPDCPVDLPMSVPDRPAKFYPAIPMDAAEMEAAGVGASSKARSVRTAPSRPAPVAAPASPTLDEFANEPDLRRLPGKLWPESLAYQRAQEEKARQSANGSPSGDSRPIPDDPSS